MIRTLAILSALFMSLSIAHAETKEVRASKQWTGSVEDAELAKEAPELITNANELEKLWKSWKLKDKVPEVDFDKQLIVVTTTVGSKVSLTASLDDEGDLKVTGVATSDFGPGFRYVIATLSRDGVKTVNGKGLKKK